MEEGDILGGIMKPLSIEPNDIIFENICEGKTYTKDIMITNNMKLLTPVEIKSTSEDKISINPREIKLSHLQKQRIIVELRMHKPFAEKNGVKVPIKESIFINLIILVKL